jgi:hypothetical protein
MVRSLVDLCTDLAWSQWTALGVSASKARVPKHAVDLEAAIAFAPILDRLDPRLYEEAAGWCTRYAHQFVSVTRLKQVLPLFATRHRVAFDHFAAIVNRGGTARWPTPRTANASVRVSDKARVKLGAPASIQLRARKTFGVNARADILVALLLAPRTWARISELANLGYTKRNLSDALGDLHAGGVLEALRVGNALRYRLAKPRPLGQLLGPVPRTHWQPWGQRFAIVERLLDAELRTTGKSMALRTIELKKTLDAITPDLAAIEEVVPRSTGDEPWRDIARWASGWLQA